MNSPDPIAVIRSDGAEWIAAFHVGRARYQHEHALRLLAGREQLLAGGVGLRPTETADALELVGAQFWKHLVALGSITDISN